jgi:SAM-dependent methyltransferase
MAGADCWAGCQRGWTTNRVAAYRLNAWRTSGEVRQARVARGGGTFRERRGDSLRDGRQSHRLVWSRHGDRAAGFRRKPVNLEQEVQEEIDPLPGTGLMQSPVEWAVRSRVLAGSLARLIGDRLPGPDGCGVDIGCRDGDLIDQITEESRLSWVGIDPILEENSFTEKGAPIGPGRADAIPYPDAHFDAAILANVFEHIAPDARQESLDEICRVLRPGGILAGQIPNPYFPIESHSRLPFMGFLPIRLQRHYWRLSPVPWEHDFFVVTMRHLRRHAVASGFRVAHSSPFNYPPEAIPSRVRPVARMGAPLMRVFPWAWQFVFVKSD